MWNPAWGYLLPCLTAVREVYASVWLSLSREDVGIKPFVDDLAMLMLVMYGVTELVAGQGRRETGGVFSVVCARIFDFVIFVDHVVFYTKHIPELQGMKIAG